MRSPSTFRFTALALIALAALAPGASADRDGHGSRGSGSRGSSSTPASRPSGSQSSRPASAPASSRPSAPQASRPSTPQSSRPAATPSAQPQDRGSRGSQTPSNPPSEPRGSRETPNSTRERGAALPSPSPARTRDDVPTPTRTDPSGASGGARTRDDGRADTTPTRDDGSRGGRETPNLGGATRASRRAETTPGATTGGPSSAAPGARARTRTQPADDDGANDAGVPVIRSERRISFPRPAETTPTRTDGAPSSRRRAANEIERSATRKRPPGADAELPTRNVDRKSILERYDRARGENRTDGRPSSSANDPSRRIKNAREKAATAAALEKRIKNARSEQRDDPDRIRNARGRHLEATGNLRDLAYRYPERARKYEQAGRSISRGKDVSCRSGYGAALGCTTGWWWFDWCPGFWYGDGYEDCGFYWTWWWNGCHPWSGTFWWGHPYNYSCWYAWGWWPGSYWGNSYWYYPGWYGGPTYYTTVIERYYEPETTTTTYADPAPADTSARGEGVIAEPAPEPRQEGGASADRALLDSLLVPSTKSELSQASEEYLVLGDNAFTERRYGDAVHFYAKAVEFSPDDGMLYLILSDALFATGDYHYAAYALRRALELDPSLASLEVDKHDFYKADRLEFDRQLAVLELYLQDQPNDDDARLVLAANYLFGARPAAAVDLLDKPESRKVRQDDAARLMYEAAKVLQYGKPAEAGK
jgi:tetratricopeptide (TPR) repeat protein